MAAAVCPLTKAPWHGVYAWACGLSEVSQLVWVACACGAKKNSRKHTIAVHSTLLTLPLLLVCPISLGEVTGGGSAVTSFGWVWCFLPPFFLLLPVLAGGSLAGAWPGLLETPRLPWQ